MFLTRFALNSRRRGAGRLLASPQAMHAAVLAGFPDASARPAGRILWRVDRSGHDTDLYVVSPERPDFTHLVEQAGWPTTATWDTRAYGDFLARIDAGTRWAFRITANPTNNLPASEHRDRGAVRALLDAPDQEAWLMRQAQRCGFRIITQKAGDKERPSLFVRDSETVSFARNGAKVTITRATFDGILEVVEAEHFRAALTHGIGRAKAYGCGLLTLAPIATPTTTA